MAALKAISLSIAESKDKQKAEGNFK